MERWLERVAEKRELISDVRKTKVEWSIYIHSYLETARFSYNQNDFKIDSWQKTWRKIIDATCSFYKRKHGQIQIKQGFGGAENGYIENKYSGLDESGGDRAWALMHLTGICVVALRNYPNDFFL